VERAASAGGGPVDVLGDSAVDWGDEAGRRDHEQQEDWRRPDEMAGTGADQRLEVPPPTGHHAGQSSGQSRPRRTDTSSMHIRSSSSARHRAHHRVPVAGLRFRFTRTPRAINQVNVICRSTRRTKPRKLTLRFPGGRTPLALLRGRSSWRYRSYLNHCRSLSQSRRCGL